MAIKLVAIDVDDTLITDELIIPENCKKAIQCALAKGVRVVLASGRMFQSMLGFARELGISGPLIAYNGALIKRTDGSVMFHEPVPLPEALEIARYAQATGFHLNAYLNDELYVEKIAKETEYYTNLAGLPAHPVGDLYEFIKEPPTKLLFVLEDKQTPMVLVDLKEQFGDRLEITSSKAKYVEITGMGISKGKALAVLVADLQVAKEEVMAIGDGLNDLTMIEFAGVGVAVRNAAEELRRRADYVTVSNEEGGVAEAIEKFVL